MVLCAQWVDRSLLGRSEPDRAPQCLQATMPFQSGPEQADSSHEWAAFSTFSPQRDLEFQSLCSFSIRVLN
jgi:hypothetical protein